MIAVDTNVVVRLLTGDDPKQAAAAKSLFASEPVWISRTVLLETGWVLQSLYGLDEKAIRDAFTKLLGLKSVSTEDKSAMMAALGLTVHGVELADAIHLTSRRPGSTFVTFDKVFVRRAKRAGVTAISAIPAHESV